jgi:Protein of unknown function (DUF2934)
VNTGTVTQERHRAMAGLVRRRIRLRARELYEERGHVEGFALEDWLKAESEVLKTSMLAPLYRRSRNGDQASPTFDPGRGAPEPPPGGDGGHTTESLPFSSIVTTS